MMDFLKRRSFPLAVAFALSACGGGSNDNDPKEAPSVPVLQTAGSLTVSPYKKGKPLSFSQIQSEPLSSIEY